MKLSFTDLTLEIVSVFLAIMVICSDSKGQQSSQPTKPQSLPHRVEVPKDLKFEPPWREKGDCAPLSLYVLMHLNDRKVSLADVKEVIPFDVEKGASLADIARGAENLGFSTEIRFVDPDDLTKVPRPFIFYGRGSLERGIGHFFVIVDYSPEKQQYYLIDTTHESFYNLPEQSVLNLFSGYVLLPKSPMGGTVRNLVGLSLFFFGLLGMVLILYRYPIGKKTTTAGNPRVICQ